MYVSALVIIIIIVIIIITVSEQNLEDSVGFPKRETCSTSVVKDTRSALPHGVTIFVLQFVKYVS